MCGLMDEHWRAAAVAAVRRYRESDPRGWDDYLAEASELAATDLPINEDWAGGHRFDGYR